MKLHRPYIPISTRLQVAERQIDRAGLWLNYLSAGFRVPPYPSPTVCLKLALKLLFGDQPCHLDHDPSLGARPFNERTGKYEPDANSLNHLVYRLKEDHRVKTFIRGEHGQHSDIVLIKRERRRKRKAATKTTQKKQRQLRAAVLGLKVKRKIPSRPFPKRVRGK